jgi:alpha-beta hydrolase superfamily lysophospholipase/uncharacterized membrane protein HdeD (DUF308 family)
MLRFRWLATVPALSCVAIGAVLTVSPFSTMAALVVLAVVGLVLTGLGELVRVAAARTSRLAVAAGAGWLAVGIAVAVWPGVTPRVLAVMVGLALVGGGAARAAGLASGQRLAYLSPAASVVAGVAALTWPHPTVFVVAVTFGLPLVLFGIADVLATLKPTDKPARWHPAVAAAAALVLVAVGAWAHAALPRPDAFYAAPGQVPPTPGVLLRSEALPRAAPPGAVAWRILYTTTRDEHTPAIASALVLRAERVPAGPRPVIAWAHGATGIAAGCAPSLVDNPLGSGAMPGLDEALANGWVVVATDYTGLGTTGPHPFLIGQGEARSVLDAVRAARHLSGVTLGGQTVVWGHSQGGNASLWSGILAPSYAPDAGVIGVAALAPGSELTTLAQVWGTGAGGVIFGAYLIEAYSETYPDVSFGTYVRPAAAIPVRELANRCLSEPKIYLSGASSLLFGQSIWATDPATGAAGARLRQNTPTGSIAVPVLVAQGGADTVVLPSAQAEYVHGRCADGGRVDYRTYPGRDHVGLIAADSPLIPELVRWTQDRLDGRPAADTCPA